jgi:hypothetical protein
MDTECQVGGIETDFTMFGQILCKRHLISHELNFISRQGIAHCHEL